MIPFGPQLIGQTEKALSALLQTVLTPHGLSEREWVSLRLTAQFDGAGELDAFLADRLPATEVGPILTDLRHRGLLAGSALTPTGEARVAEIGREIADLTGPLWADLDPHETDAAAAVLNRVLDKARLLLLRGATAG